jgi:hypothetical protein
MVKKSKLGSAMNALALLVIMNVAPGDAAWVNVTGNLAGHASACGNVFALVAVPGQNKIIVSVCGNQGLFASADNGSSWQAMGASTGWVDPQNIVFDKDNPNVFWESGMHGGMSHKTIDGGATFTVINNPDGHWGGDGIGIDMTDPQRKTIVLGAHETSFLVKSTDGGATWTNITSGTLGWTNFPVVIDAQTYVLGSINGGIFRTTNSGTSWTSVSTLKPGWDPLVTSKGDIYFAADGNQAVIRSTDKGLSWTSMAKAGSGSGWYTPIEMPDGSIVAIGQNTLVQCKNGTTWTAIGSAFPSGTPGNKGNIGYNSATSTFFMAFWDCNTTVPANALWKETCTTCGEVSIRPLKMSGLRTVHLSTTRIAINPGKNTVEVVNNGKKYSLHGHILGR